MPYRHAGRNRNGIDCVGLIIKVAHELGLSEYDTTNYGRRPVPADFLREMRDHLVAVPASRLDHGEIAVFTEPRHPCHVGIIERDGADLYVIHAYALARKVVRDRLIGERLERVLLGVRYKGA